MRITTLLGIVTLHADNPDEEKFLEHMVNAFEHGTVRAECNDLAKTWGTARKQSHLKLHEPKEPA